VRHLAWVESFLAGRQDPEHVVDWSRFPHIAHDFGRSTEIGVDVRRSQSQRECCDELAGLVDVRLAQFLAMEPLALDVEVMGVFGRPVPFDRLIRLRSFDSWVHEQDIRRAVGLPANLATPGAQVAAVQMARAFGFALATNAEASEGATAHLTVTGPIAFEQWAVVREAKGVPTDPVEAPTVSLTTDWETYARLSAGRLHVSAPDVQARISLGGDPDLAARLPAALAITP
jgi:uncharacterized protein (TIGR03083 family)